MATKAWRAEEFRRSTTFEDLQQVVGCSTRVAILIALAARPMHVTALQQLLNFQQSLLSSHLKVLRETGLVDYEKTGTRRTYFLTAAVAPSSVPFARVVVTETALTIHLTGDDRSTLDGMVPQSSPVMRVLAAACAAGATAEPPQPQVTPNAKLKPASTPAAKAARSKRKRRKA